MKLPDNLSLRQALAVREVVAGAEEELDVWYGEGPGKPRVRIQGDELVMESEGGLAMNVKVPLLQYILMAWTPYFMAAQSPEAARRTLRQLTEGHMTDQQREHTVRLETWMRAACMRLGPIGANPALYHCRLRTKKYKQERTTHPPSPKVLRTCGCYAL
jgi:hypothetical protein